MVLGGDIWVAGCSGYGHGPGTWHVLWARFQAGWKNGWNRHLQVICQAACASRKVLETALLTICLHWQLVEKGERNTKLPVGYHCVILFDQELEFFLLLVLRELRWESPCGKTSSSRRVFAETPCGCCLTACARRVLGTDVTVVQSQRGDPQQQPRVCCQQRGNAWALLPWHFALYGGNVACQDLHFQIFRKMKSLVSLGRVNAKFSLSLQVIL